MPTIKLKSRWIAACAAAAALLALPAAAQATLVFSRNPLHPVVYVAADNGSAARRVGPGRSPRVSPDGQTIAYLREGSGKSQAQGLVVAPAAGGAPRLLAANWSDTFIFAWSPDSTTVAVLLGPPLGRQRLTTIDVATGAQRTISSGYFGAVSFSPEGGELVYSKATSEHFPPHSDIFRAGITGGAPVQITHDGRSESPLWGPGGKIVFVKLLGAKQRRYGPKNELYLMNPSGGQAKRLTHTVVGPLVQGLTPTAWSASGGQLLTEFGGEDTTFAVTVNPRTGAERTLTKERETGFVGAALSADGSAVLGDIGGFEPGPDHKVVAIPYGGGKPKVLAKNAFEPDWSR
jgi:Tol biopolymer transport system component